MREFEYAFEQGLAKGLRTHHKNPRNQEALVEAYNMRAGSEGLEPYLPLGNGFGEQPTSVWPFPQLLIGSTCTLLVTRDAILDAYRVYRVEDNWSLTHLVDVDDLTFGEGGPFDMVELGSFVLLVNESTLIRRDPTSGAWNGYNANTLYAPIPLMRTMCNFKGQLVGGGVGSTWYDCGSDALVWSRIGSETFTPDRSNTAGFRRLPRGGNLLRTLRLGNTVVGYSDREVVALVPTIDPAPTFGLQEMIPVGIPSRGCVGGWEQEHLFVDNSGWLWKLTEKGPTRLGYQEFISQLTAANIVITFEPTERDFYITDGCRCFLYSAYGGLTEVHQCVNGAGLVNYERAAVWHAVNDLTARVTTDTLDFGMRGLKTLEALEFGLDSPHPLQASVWWRSERRKVMVQGPWVEVNDQGAVAYPISGNDLRISLRATHYEELYLDYIKLRWKMTDLRTLRGVYAPPTSARGQR